MEAEQISSDDKVKGVEPAKIVHHQDGQDCSLMPVSGLECIRLRCGTEHLGANPAGRDATRAAVADTDSTRSNRARTSPARAGCLRSITIDASAGRNDSWPGQIRQHADSRRRCVDFLDGTRGKHLRLD